MSKLRSNLEFSCLSFLQYWDYRHVSPFLAQSANIHWGPSECQALCLGYIRQKVTRTGVLMEIVVSQRGHSISKLLYFSVHSDLHFCILTVQTSGYARVCIHCFLLGHSGPLRCPGPHPSTAEMTGMMDGPSLHLTALVWVLAVVSDGCYYLITDRFHYLQPFQAFYWKSCVKGRRRERENTHVLQNTHYDSFEESWGRSVKGKASCSWKELSDMKKEGTFEWQGCPSKYNSRKEMKEEYVSLLS